MLKNRWFKSTLGIPAEILIAQSLDASNSPSAGTAPTGTLNVTIAATPTLGDTLVINVDGYIYTYTVGAGETTAALAATAIEAMLDANNQGFTASHTGTTSAVFTLTGPVGTTFNGKTVSATEGGSTFSAITSANFSGGVNPVVGFQSTFKDFVATAAAGAMAAYWADTQDAVTFGSTSLPVNKDRPYFYAWKQADETVKVSTTISPSGIEKKTQIAYYAGQGDTFTVTLGGTYTAGQYIHLRIIDTTSTILPYPSWEFVVKSSGTANTDAAAMRDKINAETIDKVFTASAATNVITIVFSAKDRTFKVLADLETTKTATTDASVITIAHTVMQKGEIGTYKDIKELELYFRVQQGQPLYSGDGHTNIEEFGVIASNVVSGINYGILILKTMRFERGEVRNFRQPLYVVIALPTASLATLAGL